MSKFPTLVAVLVLLAGAPFAGAGDDPDAIDDALADSGLTRADVGFEPRGWWSRHPGDIPWKLRHFDDLMAEPFATIPWVRAMGASVTEHLTPGSAAKRGVRGARPLHQAVFELGVNRKLGTFRAYSANLTAEPTPLDDAIIKCFEYARRPTKHVTFGQESPYPKTAERIRARVKEMLADDISASLGQLVLNLLEARMWADRAFRNVPLELRMQVAKRMDIGMEEVDALDYEPAFDDVARLWDEASLWYAAMKTVDALDLAREALLDATKAPAPTPVFGTLRFETPLGAIVLHDATGGGAVVGAEGAFLVVDLGGDDVWQGHVAASGPTLPISAFLDLGGDDRYETPPSRSDRSQGAGLVGVGVLLDANGADRYTSEGSLCQGAGQFGFGALIDLAGDDVYRAEFSAQGCGYFGIGLLLDAGGDDTHYALAESQGFGGVAGVGVLADRSGKDRYTLDPDPAQSERASYHTDQKVSVSNGQGCAMGRRGDGADGHSWAGGLGALLDAEGDDTYVAGNWAQGCGYWFGMGALWDGAGNDTYTANGWASASGAHFCIGVLVDDAGDDVHTVTQNWGPAFGHDFTVALLVNEGGDDRYVCGGDGLGWAINRSIVALIEVGGDDRYEMAKAAAHPGTSRLDKRYTDRSGPSLYWTEAMALGLFLDVGGSDTYVTNGSARDGGGPAIRESEDSDDRKAASYSIFVDRSDGNVDLDRIYGSKR